MDWRVARLRSWLRPKAAMSTLDSINPSLRTARESPAPVLPLRDEPRLLSWLETKRRWWPMKRRPLRCEHGKRKELSL